MPDTYIVGNSGAARECYWILRDLLESAPGLAPYYNFRGFYSWGGHPDNLKDLSPMALGPVEDKAVQLDATYIIGAGQPRLRRDIFRYLKERGAKLMNLIHPWTSICPSAKIGEGNVFQRGCTIYPNAEVGDGNYINGAANLSHDAKIGDFNFLGPYSIVLGGASIGDMNHLGPCSMVMDKSRVGNNNIIAPGTIIYKGCKHNCRMAGNPALRIGAVENGA